MNIVLKNPKEIREVTVSLETFKLDDFMAVVRYGAKVRFAEDVCLAVKRNRARVDRYLEEGRIYYGVTTGFGDNVQFTISPKDAGQLQKNIVRTHSVSVGTPYTRERVRSLILTTIVQHRKGYGGIALETLELLRDFLNRDLLPFIPGEGCMGGLGPEGHLAMALIGEGAFLVDGKRVPAKDVLASEGLAPRELKCKEGLSLLNGCICATALSIPPLYDCITAMKTADIATAICFEALRGTTKTLDPRIYMHKEHLADRATADNMRRLTAGSEICAFYRDSKVQDAYVLRSAARVHGAGKQLVLECYDAIMKELNSCPDNPQVYDNDTEEGECLMSANFDGTLMAIHADMLCMASAIVATNCERSTDRMINHHLSDGLPPFLVTDPGLNSGFMIPQYTAAGLLSDIKQACMPSTIDSIPVSAGQEDPNPMAYSAGPRAQDCMRRFHYILAIELVTALQAVDFVQPQKQGPATKAVHDFIRQKVSFMDKDRFIYPDLEYVYGLIREGTVVEIAEAVAGVLNFE